MESSGEQDLLTTLLLWAFNLPAGGSWLAAEPAAEAFLKLKQQATPDSSMPNHEDSTLTPALHSAVLSKRFEAAESMLPRVDLLGVPESTLQELDDSAVSKCIPGMHTAVTAALGAILDLRATGGEGREYGSSMGSPQYQGFLLDDVGAPHVDADLRRWRASRWAKKGVFPALDTIGRDETRIDFEHISDGDANGVLHFAGRNWGTQPWMNPVVLGTVSIKASSPLSRHTDGKLLVSRNYSATCFAGPCMLGGKSSAWWEIDLGPHHRLCCTFYTLRADGSRNFPRSWVLEGSCDKKAWLTLRRHVADSTLCQPGQYGSWPIISSMNSRLRCFRLRLIDPTVCSRAPWHFHVCYIELYGALHVLC